MFCERGAFDEDQARAILQAGKAKGLARPAARQPARARARASGSPASSAWPRSTTAPTSTDADVDALAARGTTATLLPGVEFSTRSPYPDARRLLDAGVPVAIASDCNPGSCYTSSMPLCIALAVREMGMSPAEALTAATRGGARALGRTDVGHLGVGGLAPTSRCWTRRRTSTWPTGPASRWSARRSSAAAAPASEAPGAGSVDRRSRTPSTPSTEGARLPTVRKAQSGGQRTALRSCP